MPTRGEMLRLARHFRGMTQKEAAARLELAQTLVSRVENGLIEADDEIVVKASRAYQLPRDFFSIPDTIYGPPVSVHALFRAKSDLSAREVDLITAELNYRLIQLRRFLNNVDFRPKVDLPILDAELYDSPEKIAAIVRSHWGVVRGPIKNMVRLLERAGVVIGFSDFGGASVSGVTFKPPGCPPLILLNRSHPSDRLQFTMAHELAHLVMHRFPTPSMEHEADCFASAFLLPPDEMKQAFRGRKVTLELLAAMKREWRASMQALLMAAKSCNCISPNQTRYLWQQISRRGWRLREPPELDFELDTPQVLPSILKMHVDELDYSFDELLKISVSNRKDFERFYGSSSDGEQSKPRLRVVS